MLPIGSNHKSSTCAVLSSNCVIWHGAAIPCLNLCKDDTITDVILKMGEILCDTQTTAGQVIVDTTPLGNPTTWTTYNDVIQYIVDDVADLTTFVNNIVVPPTPNLTASVATCLQSIAGGPTLGVVSYTELLGNEVCTLKSLTGSLETDIDTNTTNISIINNILSTLPTTYAAINSTYVCLGSGVDSVVNIVTAIEQELCDLEAQTGSPAELGSNIAPYCNISNSPALSVPGTMASGYPEWNTTVSTLGDTIKNLWITVCDMRTRLVNLADCCTSTCADIRLGFRAELNTNILRVRTSTGSELPSDFIQCLVPASTITITDGDGTSFTTVFNNIESLIAGGFQDIDLTLAGLNLATDFTADVSYCFSNITTGLQCQNVISFNIINTVACPTLTLTSTWNNVAGTGTIGYSFNNLYIASPTTKYRLTVYDATSAVVGILTTAVASTLSNPVTGSFIVANTGNYTVEIKIITVNTGTGVETISNTCPAELITVQNSTCLPPTNLFAVNIT